MRRASKVDANQEAIVQALRDRAVSVQSLAPIGKGCPDILAAHGGRMFLFEVKNPSGKDVVNEAQKKWHIAWNAEVYTVRSPSEALEVIFRE